MTRVRLSERMANAEETCARCEHDVDGKCELPILTGINRDRGTISTTRLVGFSEDGRTCQLFTAKRKGSMSKEEWLQTVVPFDVLCPKCHQAFKEVWLTTPTWNGDRSRLRMCRRCAEGICKIWKAAEVEE